MFIGAWVCTTGGITLSIFWEGPCHPGDTSLILSSMLETCHCNVMVRSLTGWNASQPLFFWRFSSVLWQCSAVYHPLACSHFSSFPSLWVFVLFCFVLFVFVVFFFFNSFCFPLFVCLLLYFCSYLSVICFVCNCCSLYLFARLVSFLGSHLLFQTSGIWHRACWLGNVCYWSHRLFRSPQRLG